MKRREFLGQMIAAGWVLATPELLRALENQAGLPLEDLRASLPETDGLILVQGDSDFAKYLPAYNLRTVKTPQIRVLPKNAKGAAAAVQWAAKNKDKVEVAARCGGHSYEGFSQNASLTIDGRLMKNIAFDPAHSMITVDSGVLLGEIYQTTGKQNQAIPAGSCPSVGAAGHTLGGGYGLLARPMGLAADSLREVEIVTAAGQPLRASDSENKDLFWALRGGGAGSFGVVTQLRYETQSVKDGVHTFSVGWTLKPDRAVALMHAWQLWAPEISKNITSIFKLQGLPNGTAVLHCMGQTVGSETELRAEMQKLINIAKPTSPLSVSRKTFLEAVAFFGAEGDPKPDFMKGKSNYVYKPMPEDGIARLIKKLQQISTRVAVTCDSYGGKISDVAADETAFFHRSAARFSMKFSTHWKTAAETERRVADMRALQTAIEQPELIVSGHSYFNYCDADIKDYGTAYWGDNYKRLQEIKLAHDPENLFRHAQSIELPK